MTTSTEQSTPEQKWFFEDDNEKELHIETCVYENGNKAKRVKLSNGKTAIARELLGKDMKRVDQICNGKKDDYLPALMIVATKIKDEAGAESFLTLEDLDELKGKDYTAIKMIATMLNF